MKFREDLFPFHIYSLSVYPVIDDIVFIFCTKGTAGGDLLTVTDGSRSCLSMFLRFGCMCVGVVLSYVTN